MRNLLLDEYAKLLELLGVVSFLTARGEEPFSKTKATVAYRGTVNSLLYFADLYRYQGTIEINLLSIAEHFGVVNRVGLHLRLDIVLMGA